MAIDFVGIGTGLGLIGLGIDRVLQYKRDRKERAKTAEYALSDNPERCRDHETRLRSIEGSCSEIKMDVAVLSTRFESVEKRIDNLAEVFNLAGEHRA